MVRYQNDERTREFFACNVRRGFRELLDITAAVNAVLKRHRLEPFYDPPTFHASFASFPLEGEAAVRSSDVRLCSSLQLVDTEEPFWVTRLSCRIAPVVHEVPLGR